MDELLLKLYHKAQIQSGLLNLIESPPKKGWLFTKENGRPFPFMYQYSRVNQFQIMFLVNWTMAETQNLFLKVVPNIVATPRFNKRL